MRVISVLFILIIVTLSIKATTIHVPSEQPTIQAGIDAAIDGDTVLVADGIYLGYGNRDILIEKSIVLTSENGPENTVINCEHYGKGMNIFGGQDSSLVINGFTIKNGSSYQGSAICCFGSSPIIKNCVFVSNIADYGGALYFNGNASKGKDVISLKVVNCTVVDNTAHYSGAGAYIQYNNIMVSFEKCIFYNNVSNDSPCIEYGYDVDTVVIKCTDMFDNNPGDWIGSMTPYEDIENNFSIDPIFCKDSSDDFTIGLTSSCEEDNSPCGELVGALDSRNCCCFVRGDVASPTNGYALVDDLTFLVNYLFKNGPAPECAASGDISVPLDGLVLINDLVYLVNFIFKGGPAPPEC